MKTPLDHLPGTDETTKFLATTERRFSAHHMLLEAATDASQRCADANPSAQISRLSTMIFSALAIEAICNCCIAQILEFPEDFEQSRPMAKLRLICEKLGVEFNRESKPWSDVAWLIAFRNSVVHAKLEPVTNEAIILKHQYLEHASFQPLSKIEKQLTAENAARAFVCALEVRNRIWGKTAHPILMDGWITSATVATKRDIRAQKKKTAQRNSTKQKVAK